MASHLLRTWKALGLASIETHSCLPALSHSHTRDTESPTPPVELDGGVRYSFLRSRRHQTHVWSVLHHPSSWTEVYAQGYSLTIELNGQDVAESYGRTPLIMSDGGAVSRRIPPRPS